MKSLIVPKNSKSVISESFRSIRTNIQYLAVDKDKKVITVSSSVGGEGKTFCSMNLASIFALSGHKTVLIGADLRKPKLELEFKSENKSGLSNYLINKSTLEEVTNKTEIEHLDIIFSGPTPPILKSPPAIQTIPSGAWGGVIRPAALNATKRLMQQVVIQSFLCNSCFYCI